MRPGLKTLLASLSTLIATMVHAAPVPPASLAEAQLRAINHRYVTAFAVPDVQYMGALIADDFVLMDTSGEWLDRAQHLDQMRASSISGGVSYDDVRIRLFGPVALVHGLFEGNAERGTVQRVRYTDVYQWNGERWRLINGQNTALRDTAPRQQRLGQAPTHAPWKGRDPAGTDIEVLHQLNENYVQAFRDANVAWYAAHLAPDYLVVHSDGSFSDRADALVDFAKPSYATYMRSFPVDKVRIRLFGDIALIHAENAYERKDGRKGVNRYTDIWRKGADGRWLCIAAHITTHKAPQ